MILSKNGTNTLDYEVTNIERLGFWIIVDNEEYFVNFEDYPKFKKATVEQILNIKRLDPEQFNWPDLDIDIDIRSLKYPEQFQKVYKD
jgi:hypothetical protein